MTDFIIHPFTPADRDAVWQLQLDYARVFPGGQVIPPQIYLSPGMHGGEDVFCAFAGDKLVAYAPLYLQLITDGPPDLPHVAWVEIKADPSLAEPAEVKDALFQRLLARAQHLLADFSGRPAQMTFQYNSSEQPAIDFVRARGFAYSDSVYAMRRDLTAPIPAAPAPPGIQLRHWKMDSLHEQLAYIEARNTCFPSRPIQLEDWQHFLSLPIWEEGTTVAAFAGSQLVGNVAVYWDADENERSGRQAGYTEYIFVLPDFRGQGVARAMIAEGLRYLRAHGLAEACLEVRADNPSALALYTGLGYTLVSESRFYTRFM